MDILRHLRINMKKRIRTMSLHKDDDKLLGKFKTIYTNIIDFKNIELDGLPVYAKRCITTKIKIYEDKV